MRRLALVSVLLSVGMLAFAQEPPGLLPASITGRKPDAAAGVTPASGTLTQPAAPAARFQDERAFPPETVAVLHASKAGADWLWRMNQSTGRFLPGLNPVTRTGISPDDDFHQALATLALVEAARFTGEDRLTVRATQAVLTMLTLTRPDAADVCVRVPTTRSRPLGFAAALMLAIRRLPDADGKLLGQAEELGGFVRKHVQDDGSIRLENGDDERTCGLVLQSLVHSQQAKPDPAKRDALLKAFDFYAGSFQRKPSLPLAANLLPALVEIALQEPLDPKRNAALFQMADFLAARQYTGSENCHPSWVGGFRSTPGAAAEPTWASVEAAVALTHAARLTRRVPDLARFQRYRNAAVSGLLFAINLQFTDLTADQFEKTFRTRYMVGGTHHSPTDGTLRVEATAAAVRGYLAYLRSGAETRVE